MKLHKKYGFIIGASVDDPDDFLDAYNALIERSDSHHASGHFNVDHGMGSNGRLYVYPANLDDPSTALEPNTDITIQ